jgi:hypothetical protein
MAKGRKISDEIVNQITRIHLKHPDWTAKEVQQEVQAVVRRENPKIAQDWPGLSTVQQVMKDPSKKGTKRSPELIGLDSPWSVITLAKYGISPEALPAVLNMAVYFRQEAGLGRRMTIREARWAAWLSSMVDLHKLFYAIQEYAEEEKAMELSKLRDEFTFMIDDELYLALTSKSIDEPVFDEISGLDVPSPAREKIRLGSAQKQKKIRNKNKRKEKGE